MATKSPRLRLNTGWVPGDTYRIDDYNENWAALDAAPGSLVCTSTTRPTTWSAAQSGRHIFETDTTLEWRWTGSAFVRTYPVGLVGEGILAGDKTGTGKTEIINATAKVPAGGKGIFISLSGGGNVKSSLGLVRLTMTRKQGADPATIVFQTDIVGSEGAVNVPLNVTTLDHPNAGTYVYSLTMESNTESTGAAMTFTGSGTTLRLLIAEV